MLSFATTLLTVMALAVPLLSSPAQAAVTEPWTISLTPASDSPVINTCDPRTVTILDRNGNPVVGQTVTVTLTMQSTGGSGTPLTIGFCNPGNAGTGAATKFGRLPSQSGPPQGGTSTTTPGTTNAGGVGADTCTANQPNFSQSINCTGSFNGNTSNPTTPPSGTDINGNLYFGVISNQTGTMNINATATAPAAGTPPSGPAGQTYAAPQSTANWQATTVPASSIDCLWDANGQGGAGPQLSGQGTHDAVAADTTHAETFTCNVKNNGQNVNGANVWYQINSGPDTPTPQTVFNCGATNPGGNVTCTFNHAGSGSTTNKTGTNNLTVWVEQGCPPPAGSPTAACTPGNPPNPGSFQSYEPNVTVTKTLTSGPRNIVCVPGTSGTSKPSGQVQNIVCTVTDVNGKVLQGIQVFGQSSGPGHFINQSAGVGCAQSGQSCLFTDANGQVSFQVQTNPGETGTESLVFQRTVAPPAQNAAGAECNKTAGSPGGSSAGNCSTTTTITWTEASPSNTTHTRSITANASRSGRCPNRRHPHRRCSAVVNGTVTDTSTAPSTTCTSGVQVLVIQEKTGKSHTVITDAAGNYTTAFKGKPRSGSYTATAPQFTNGSLTCGGATASDSL